MNETWQLLGTIAALGCGAWVLRVLAAHLALRKLQNVANHRLKLEQCWLLIAQIPGSQLSIETRKALGKILSHHLAHSRRTDANESSQELRIARLVGHAPRAHGGRTDDQPSTALAQSLRQLIAILDSALAQQIISVALHVRARDHLRRHLAQVDGALDQRKAYLTELLTLPFGRPAAART
jgi:hypothetical protein